jgi:pyruvate-formate lyase-activating enzyme
MVQIRLKLIVDENFQDYKKPSMLLATCKCDWKCLKEQELDLSICQNSELIKQKNIDIPIHVIIDRYINNPITKAIIIAGLEPILQFDELIEFIKEFREASDDDIIIFTGYYPEEISNQINELVGFKNIIVKFGRYKHNSNKKYDQILGVWLISDNQFTLKIS